VVDTDTEIEVTNAAEYDAEELVGIEIDDVVVEVVLKDGGAVETDDDSIEDEEAVAVFAVTDALEIGAGSGTTMVSGGEFTSMIEYPVVVAVAGDGVSVTTTVWNVPDSLIVFVEMM